MSRRSAVGGCGPARRGESSQVWLRRNSRKLTWEMLLKAAWEFTRSGEDGCCREEERKERVTEAWRTHSVFGRRSAVSRGPGRRLNESAGHRVWCRAVAGIGWLLCVTAEGAATRRAGGQLAGLGLAFSLARSEVRNHRFGMSPPGRGARGCSGSLPERASSAVLIMTARLSLKV